MTAITWVAIVLLAVLIGMEALNCKRDSDRTNISNNLTRQSLKIGETSNKRFINQRRKEVAVLASNQFYANIWSIMKPLLDILHYNNLTADSNQRFYNALGRFKIWKQYTDICNTNVASKGLNNKDTIMYAINQLRYPTQKTVTLATKTIFVLTNDSHLAPNVQKTFQSLNKKQLKKCHHAEQQGETTMAKLMLDYK